MLSSNVEDLKEICRLLNQLTGTTPGDRALIQVLMRLANIHCRALGYKDWADAFHNMP